MPRVGEIAPGVPNGSPAARQLRHKELARKVRYVKSQGQTRPHACHWPGCGAQVPPALWGCKRHWQMLPKTLRDKIWAAYRPGQEATMTPSREYVRVAREVQQWIKQRHPQCTATS